MSLSKPPKPKSSLPPIPAGMHHAILYSVVDIGTQYSPVYDVSQYKVIFTWELPLIRGEFEKDGVKKDAPRVTGRTYTYSFNEKANLAKDLTSWWGRALTGEDITGLNLGGLVGDNAMLQIIHSIKNPGTPDEVTYANIASVLPLMPNVEILEPENPRVVYDIQEHGTNIPDVIPSWIRDKIVECKEYKNISVTADLDDTIPF